MTECNVCYQAIIQTPRKCFTCGQSIGPGQLYQYRKARVGCEPVHLGCFNQAPPRATITQSEEGRLL